MSDKPLSGIRVAVTRARDQAEELAEPLRQLGAEVLITPLIRIVTSIDSATVRAALNNLAQYDWLVLTSVNGVNALVEALAGVGAQPGALDRLRIACVGPATATAAAHHGMRTDVMPHEFVGEALGAELATQLGTARPRILLARAGGARAELPRLLRQQGATVDEIELYRSLPDEVNARWLQQQLSMGQIDVITFTSGSTVRYFAEFAGQASGALVAVIGPATAEVARSFSIPVDLEANPHTTRGLVDAISEHFSRKKRLSED